MYIKGDETLVFFSFSFLEIYVLTRTFHFIRHIYYIIYIQHKRRTNSFNFSIGTLNQNVLNVYFPFRVLNRRLNSMDEEEDFHGRLDR